MAWTAPMTAVAGAALTASQWNTHVRDNLLETAPAKATQSGSFFVGNGANQIVERVPASAEVLAAQSTSSTSFTDLATPGPSLSLLTGTRAVVSVVARGSHNTNNHSAFASVEVSGMTSIAADRDTALQIDLGNANNTTRAGITYVIDNLNAGLNTFTVKYSVEAGTGTWYRRQISIIPF